MHDLELLMEYFEAYKAIVDKFGILPANQWNFDKTKFCISISRDFYEYSIQDIF